MFKGNDAIVSVFLWIYFNRPIPSNLLRLFFVVDLSIISLRPHAICIPQWLPFLLVLYNAAAFRSSFLLRAFLLAGLFASLFEANWHMLAMAIDIFELQLIKISILAAYRSPGARRALETHNRWTFGDHRPINMWNSKRWNMHLIRWIYNKRFVLLHIVIICFNRGVVYSAHRRGHHRLMG